MWGLTSLPSLGLLLRVILRSLNGCCSTSHQVSVLGRGGRDNTSWLLLMPIGQNWSHGYSQQQVRGRQGWRGDGAVSAAAARDTLGKGRGRGLRESKGKGWLGADGGARWREPDSLWGGGGGGGGGRATNTPATPDADAGACALGQVARGLFSLGSHFRHARWGRGVVERARCRFPCGVGAGCAEPGAGDPEPRGGP